MTQLSEHFSYDEAVDSPTARAHGIDNTPFAGAVSAMTMAAKQMEAVRTLLEDNPIHVSSWYRCPALNHAVGGVDTVGHVSAHETGWAIDFECPGYGAPIDIVEYLAGTYLQFDQLIQEGTWVHISFAPAMRRQVLTMHEVNGKPTYTEGA